MEKKEKVKKYEEFSEKLKQLFEEYGYKGFAWATSDDEGISAFTLSIDGLTLDNFGNSFGLSLLKLMKVDEGGRLSEEFKTLLEVLLLSPLVATKVHSNTNPLNFIPNKDAN